MGSITIRDVPDETRSELAVRAARAGRSMQEYLRRALIELAEAPDRAEVLARIASRTASTGTQLSRESIVDAIRVDRDSR